MNDGCTFTAYQPRRADHGYQNREPRYMAMLAPCGAEVWVDGLCRRHGLIVACTEDAKSVAVVHDRTNAHAALFAEKGRRGGQKASRKRQREKEALFQ